MKKLLILLLCLSISMVSVMGFVGCGKKGDANSDDQTKQEETIEKNNDDSKDEKKESEDKKSTFTPVSDGGNYTPQEDYE